MKTLNALLVCFMIVTMLSGCSTRHANAPLPNTPTAHDQQDPPDPFVLVNPMRDDPDNPSPHNPLIKKFGDIPEVRTYMRLKQKYYTGTGMTSDEAIELYTAEAHLYPSDATKAKLKMWEKDRERYIKEGIPLGETPVLRYAGSTSHFYHRGPSGYYNVRTLPDGTRIINDWSLPGGKAVIPPKETSKSESAAADAHDQNSVSTEDEE
ncbi:hypothetical protein F4Z99_03850 [Candidatus Poribacteria bacterium]|nr:hypothetical protein [Candidatus Poribacteria bacterium]MYA98712.1 hypothetical protein [Candidatus Poribacteria bacterium]